MINFNYKTENKPQIFLLHFAGGSCYSFEFLRKHISKEFEFVSLELPGRGKRYDESLLLNRRDTIIDYTKQIQSLRNGKPYVIYGHSMGATLGLSVTKNLEDLRDFPSHLIVSGNAGPGIKDFDNKGKQKRRYAMNDSELKQELRKLGGVPEEILEDDNLYGFFSPIIRADFEVLEKDFNTNLDFVLKTPIYALMGSEEKNHKNIKNWKRFTHCKFQFKILRGDHFFVNNHPQELAKVIYNCIKSTTAVN